MAEKKGKGSAVLGLLVVIVIGTATLGSLIGGRTANDPLATIAPPMTAAPVAAAPPAEVAAPTAEIAPV